MSCNRGVFWLQQQIASDWERIIKSLILLCFGSLLFYLVISGQLRMYINPRFAVLTELAAAALFAMSAVQLFYSRSCHSHDHNAPRMWVYAIFIIPLALAVLLPGAVLDASVASSRGLSFNDGNLTSPSPGPGAMAQAVDNEINPGGQANDSGIGRSGLIQVTPDNFVRVVDTIDQAPEDYAGREIDILGFVMRNRDFAPQEFGLIRFIITCCTADATPAGFILESNGAGDYQNGTWISVRGVIGVDDYDQQVVPVIEVTSIERTAQPSDPYVYP
jgi:putative membrane protein